MAKSKRPSAKMSDTIDGDAVEKPTDQTAPPHASASKHSQTAPPPSGPSSSVSSNAGSLITFAALALSMFAIGLAGFAIWQQRQNTADIAALMPASGNGAKELEDIAEPDLANRLAALESQLATDRQSQQSALAALQDQMATPPPAADNSQNNDFGSDAKADIAAMPPSMPNGQRGKCATIERSVHWCAKIRMVSGAGLCRTRSAAMVATAPAFAGENFSLCGSSRW